MNTRFAKFVFAAAAAVATINVVPASAIGFQTMAYEAPVMQVALLPPAGMVLFCRSHASQCRADDASNVAMSNELMGMLQSVNTRVNHSITPRNDTGRDNWSMNVSTGDCEDYALTKRAQLIRKGVPAGALRMATTNTRRGEPHAILIVKTTAGDYVLDNLSASVRPLGSTGYHLRKVSTPDPRVWAAG